MTPEEAGIFNTASHMKHLIEWMQTNQMDEFASAELPDHLKGKWMRRAQHKEFVRKIRINQGDNINVWGISGKHMTKRNPYTLVMTDDKITNAIKNGHQTSTDLAETIGVHKVTMRVRLIKMWREGLLIRRKIGQTYFYGVVED